MLILDKDRALDRMIWLSGRHALVVPEEFTHEHAPSAAAVAPPAPDHTWRWRAALLPGPAPAGRTAVRFGPSPSAA